MVEVYFADCCLWKGADTKFGCQHQEMDRLLLNHMGRGSGERRGEMGFCRLLGDDNSRALDSDFPHPKDSTRFQQDATRGSNPFLMTRAIKFLCDLAEECGRSSSWSRGLGATQSLCHLGQVT